MKLDDAAARLEALGNPTRLKIYRTLVRAGRGGHAGRPAAGAARRRRLDAVASPEGAGRSSAWSRQAREGTTLICHANYDMMRGLIDYMVEECCAEGDLRARPVEAAEGRLSFFAIYFDILEEQESTCPTR